MSVLDFIHIKMCKTIPISGVRRQTSSIQIFYRKIKKEQNAQKNKGGSYEKRKEAET